MTARPDRPAAHDRELVAQFSDVWTLAGVAVLRYRLTTEALTAVQELIRRARAADAGR